MSIIAQSSGTIPVAPGASTVTIAGSFGSSYQVAVTPSWQADYSITNKTEGNFVVTFSAPAPPAGGLLDWIVLVTAIAVLPNIQTGVIVATGSGSLATLGQTGGAGPQSSAQTGWVRFQDGQGVNHFQPDFSP